MRFAPIGPEQPEVWFFLYAPVFPLFGILAVMIGIRAKQDTPTKRTKAILSMCLIPLLCLPTLATLQYNRDSYVQKLRLQIDGSVVEKYRSRNHAAPSLRIQSATGDVSELDGILTEAWKEISVGDQIQKTSWSESAVINGRPTHLITR